MNIREYYDNDNKRNQYISNSNHVINLRRKFTSKSKRRAANFCVWFLSRNMKLYHEMKIFTINLLSWSLHENISKNRTDTHQIHVYSFQVKGYLRFPSTCHSFCESCVFLTLEHHHLFIFFSKSKFGFVWSWLKCLRISFMCYYIIYMLLLLRREWNQGRRGGISAYYSVLDQYTTHKDTEFQ